MWGGIGNVRVEATTYTDTFPKLLLLNAAQRGERPAMREKDLGIWQAWTWEQVLDEVRAFALGLRELGLARDDKVAIVGNNRPRLYWSMCAAQSLGAVPVPVYQDSVADEMAYVLAHAGVKVAVVENQEQVDKLLSISERLPDLAYIVYDETARPAGLRPHPAQVVRRRAENRPRARSALVRVWWQDSVSKGKGSDLCVILYTSGTTGRPKGVMLTYDNAIKSSRNANAYDKLDENEEVIAYLPMAWVGDHIFSYAQSYCAGYCVNCPESPETIIEDRREIGTTYAFAPPRIYENLLTLTMVRIEDAGAIKHKMFHYFMGVAQRWGEKILNKERVPLLRAISVLARQYSRLCAAEESLRALARSRRLHRRAKRSARKFFATTARSESI